MRAPALTRLARPAIRLVAAAAILAGLATLVVLAVSGAHPALRPLARDAGRAVAGTPPLASWPIVAELVLGGALVASVLAVRALPAPRPPLGESSADALSLARAVVDAHGEDSLSPFVLGPDKQLTFAAGGVVAHRTFGETVVVSGDPVAPDGSHAQVLERLLARAREDGREVVLYGCSGRHLADYARLRLRAVRVGEEAIVDPAAFTLEGRRVRKLRQSVHRVARRGWSITACEGREIDARLEREVDALEAAWRGRRGRLLGFAMSMGACDLGVRPADLYLLARSPDGELRAVMRFLSHRGGLSLDTMRRVGETPNGLNEALVARALEQARRGGIREVSLNYAGLAHLVRREPSRGRVCELVIGAALRLLGRRFQMDRLVTFCDKFSPEWRPRYLVYGSRAALPRSVLRVLQAEGYLRR